MTAEMVDNHDRTPCDDCPNAPPKMVLVKAESYANGSLFLCRVCFKKLKGLVIK